MLQRNKQGECHFLRIDHGNCFPDHIIPQFKYRTVHKWCLSLLNELVKIYDFIEEIQGIPNDTILNIIRSVPDDWMVSDHEKESLYNYLVNGKQTLPKLLEQNSSNDDLLNRDEVLDKINHAIENKHPLSLARIGNGENIVLAQYSILSEEEFMKTGTARKWPKHGAGVKLPDTKARDEGLGFPE